MAVLFLFTGCMGKGGINVSLHLIGAFNRQFYLEKMAFNDDSLQIIDSGRAAGNNATFNFRLPAVEAAAYQIRFRDKPFQLIFINDSKNIGITCNYTNGQYRFTNSPGSTSWKEFQRAQGLLAERQGMIVHRIDSLRKAHSTEKVIDSANRQLNRISRDRYLDNLQFADTVQNAALFMLAYNMVDYGKDFDGLQHFMERAVKRFPLHAAVQTLAKNTFDYLKVFREEYQVGDHLPDLVLPDPSGNNISIHSIRNKYVLMDFWSTWCDRCRIFSDAKKAARIRMDSNKFGMISIAIDAEKDSWRKVIAYEKYDWPQLIDEKMWAGSAVRTLKFDSIPFNFLLAPDGRIVAKAIPADSLLAVLSEFIK
jgi:thiol-disulfide isomerase/thioredoxin